MKTTYEKARIVYDAMNDVSQEMTAPVAKRLMDAVADCPNNSLAKLYDFFNPEPIPMTTDDTFNSTTGNARRAGQ